MLFVMVRGLLIGLLLSIAMYFFPRNPRQVADEQQTVARVNTAGSDTSFAPGEHQRKFRQVGNIGRYVALLVVMSLAGGLVWRLKETIRLVSWAEPVAAWSSEVDKVAGAHTQVTGVLAGFTITLIVVFATLRLERAERKPFSLSEETTVSLLFVAFFGYVTAGILYSIVIERQDIQRYFFFSAASNLYYLSVVLSFGALSTLMEMMNNNPLRNIGRLALLGALLGGFPAIAIPLIDLLRINWQLILLIFVASLLAAPLLPYDKQHKYFTSIFLPICIAFISFTFLMCMSGFFVQDFDTFFAYSAVELMLTTTIICMYVGVEVYRQGHN